MLTLVWYQDSASARLRLAISSYPCVVWKGFPAFPAHLSG